MPSNCTRMRTWYGFIINIYGICLSICHYSYYPCHTSFASFKFYTVLVLVEHWSPCSMKVHRRRPLPAFKCFCHRQSSKSLGVRKCNIVTTTTGSLLTGWIWKLDILVIASCWRSEHQLRGKNCSNESAQTARQTTKSLHTVAADYTRYKTSCWFCIDVDLQIIL